MADRDEESRFLAAVALDDLDMATKETKEVAERHRQQYCLCSMQGQESIPGAPYHPNLDDFDRWQK